MVEYFEKLALNILDKILIIACDIIHNKIKVSDTYATKFVNMIYLETPNGTV